MGKSTVCNAVLFFVFRMVFNSISRTSKKQILKYIVFVVLLISYTIFMMPWCMIPLLQWTLPWPTYVNIISIIISEIDFLPAYFVIIGIGLAYFRKGKTDKSLSTEQTDE